MSLRSRRAFTLIELMVVITIIGLIARIAVPRVLQFRLRGEASRIVGDMETIRGAAFHVVADSGVWPVGAGVGTIPAALKPYLPSSLSFTPRPGVSYEWRLTGMPNGDPELASVGATMGMGADVTDPALMAELQRLLAGQTTLVSGSTIYWLLWGPTTRP